MLKFDGKILIVGCGGVSQCAVPLLLKHIDVNPKNVTILDFVDNQKRVKEVLDKGVNYVIGRITRDNYEKLLSEYLSPGDVFIDLAWDIDTITMLDWCHKNDVKYINTSVELWEPYKGAANKRPTELTLYARQMAIRKLVSGWGQGKHASAVVDHGANPGLVSHFTKQALIEIGQKIVQEKPKDKRVKSLEKALAEQDFAQLAHLSGLKTIHISERDTQISSKPKEVNEFVNTWSAAGFYEEGVAPAELGWGTHEKRYPIGTYTHKEGPKNQICLASRGMNTWCRSWVPCGEITGMVVRHGEAFSISDKLTVWQNGNAIYRPTVHYVYCPCDAAINSLHELEMRQFVVQPKIRIMSDEITSGRDELGCLLLGHDFNAWWIGSLLDIEETRQLAPHQNATTLQVAISVTAAVMWMIENPKKGVCVPDDLPHEYILGISKPYLGPFMSEAVDWTPLQNRQNLYLEYGYTPPKDEDVWQFSTFLVSQTLPHGWTEEAEEVEKLEESHI